MPQQQYTLQQRRAHLRELMKQEDAQVAEYHAVLGGATEEERKSLARTLPVSKILGKDTAQTTYSPLGVYLLAALSTNPARTVDRLWWMGFNAHRVKRGKCLFHAEGMEYFKLGLGERGEEWILRFITEGGVPATDFIIIHEILHRRGISCEIPEYLWAFLREIPAVNAKSTKNHTTAVKFFKDHLRLMEHELWACFRVEGTIATLYFADEFDMPTLFRLLEAHFPGLRQRVLTETLQSLLRDFAPSQCTGFYRLYRGMEPSEAENLDRAGQLIAILGAGPSASVGLAQEMLNTVIPGLSAGQLQQVLDASSGVLARTEKKVLRAQLRLLGRVAKEYPETAERISGIIAEALEIIPLDIQTNAQKLILPADRQHATEGPGQGISIPENTPCRRALGERFTPGLPIAHDEEFTDVLWSFFGWTPRGHDYRDTARMLAYLEQHPKVALTEAQLKHLYKAYQSTAGWFSATDYLLYTVLKPYGDRYELTWSEKFSKKSFLSGHSTDDRLLLEQLTYINNGPASGLAPVITAPAPAVEREWERETVVRTFSYPYYEYEDRYIKWSVPGQKPVARTAPVMERVLTTARRKKRDTIHWWSWWSWLLQHNPDILAAQAMRTVIDGNEMSSRGSEFIDFIQFFGDIYRVPGGPVYSLLGVLANAGRTEHRAWPAEIIARLIDRGMFDASLMAREVSWLLTEKHIMAHRVAVTFEDAASISPLAGWRILQMLRQVLPALGSVNRGGTLVQLLARLAGQYGVKIPIPDELREKTKGSTVLAKNLRGLGKFTARPTELAALAREQALELAREVKEETEAHKAI